MGGSNSKLSDARKAEIHRRVGFLKARAQFAKLLANANDKSFEQVEQLKNAMVGYPVSRNFAVRLKNTFLYSPVDEKNGYKFEYPVTRTLDLTYKVVREIDGKDVKDDHYDDIPLFDLLSLPFHELDAKSAQSVICVDKFFLGLTEIQSEFLFPSPFAKP